MDRCTGADRVLGRGSGKRAMNSGRGSALLPSSMHRVGILMRTIQLDKRKAPVRVEAKFQNIDDEEI
jgi:hypothetical protein